MLVVPGSSGESFLRPFCRILKDEMERIHMKGREKDILARRDPYRISGGGGGGRR